MYEQEHEQATIDMTSMEREFIKKYEQLPLLWKRDHPDYSNKHRRNVAYTLLLPVLRKFMPSANIYNVRQKINILRSTYRKELRKHFASKTLTAEGEILYTHIPPTWKFEAMKFLKDLNDKDFSQSEIVIEETVNDDSFNELENYSFQDQELVFIEEQDVESGNEDQGSHLKPSSPLFVSNKVSNHVTNVRYPRKRTKQNNELIIDRECVAIGSNVSCKLQRMNNEQRYFAEQLINKVLMRGLKDTLTEETDLMDSHFLHKMEQEEIS